MKITVTGIKRKPEKNGAHIHYTYNENDVIGQAVDHKWLNNSTYLTDNVIIGNEYDVEVNGYRFNVLKEM